MKNWAIACFAFSALTFMVAGRNIIEYPRDDISRLVGLSVGNLLVPVGMLIAGLILWDKAVRQQKDKDQPVLGEIVDEPQRPNWPL